MQKITLFSLTITILLLTFNFNSFTYSSEHNTDKKPVSVFSELEGKWQGQFAGYDTKGNILYNLDVTQIYKTVNNTTQNVYIEDKSEDGTVTTGKGQNIAIIKSDGTLEMKCIVKKSNGEMSKHQGALSKGPDGRKNIIWHSEKPGKTETFREWVEKREGGTYYMIQGMGIYENTPILMSGSYRKVE